MLTRLVSQFREHPPRNTIREGEFQFLERQKHQYVAATYESIG